MTKSKIQNLLKVWQRQFHDHIKHLRYKFLHKDSDLLTHIFFTKSFILHVRQSPANICVSHPTPQTLPPYHTPCRHKISHFVSAGRVPCRDYTQPSISETFDLLFQHFQLHNLNVKVTYFIILNLHLQNKNLTTSQKPHHPSSRIRNLKFNYNKNAD